MRCAESRLKHKVAASDSTPTSVQSTLHAIISNPRVYQEGKLKSATAIREQLVSCSIRHAEAVQPPYLQACTLDGLRKFPPLSQLREQLVPPKGDTIGGHASLAELPLDSSLGARS